MADLNLVVQRRPSFCQTTTSTIVQTPTPSKIRGGAPRLSRRQPVRRLKSEFFQSPAKISRRSENLTEFCYSSSDSSEASTDLSLDDLDDNTDEEDNLLDLVNCRNTQVDCGPRMRGIESLLKFDCGIRPLHLAAQFREFVYSGSCKVTISGKHVLAFSFCGRNKIAGVNSLVFSEPETSACLESPVLSFFRGMPIREPLWPIAEKIQVRKFLPLWYVPFYHLN